MTTERKRKNLKGAVLFTVVSVLAILIIFMTCTLAMAAAANKRARKTYSTSQSSYTARTVIDSVLASVAKDTTFSSAIHNLSENNSIDLVVEINNPSMGSVDNVKVTNIGKKTFYDPDVKDWTQRNILEITADVTIGGETTTIQSSIIQDPPQPPSEGGGGAAFLTYGGDLDLGNFVSSWGGTYYGMGEWTKDGDTHADKWNNQLQYYDYNPTDKFVSLANKEYWTNRSYIYKDINAVEAPFVVNGNFTLRTALSIYYTYFASGVNNPGVQFWGDLDLSNGPDFAIRMAAHLADDTGLINDFLSIPYLYVDGHMTLGTQGTIGFSRPTGNPSVDNSDKVPFNIFAGSMSLNGGGSGFNMLADLYLMDADKDSTINKNSDSALYDWAYSVTNATKSYSSNGGNVYSKGNVIFENNHTIEGDVRVEGDVLLNGNLVVEGDLVVGGKIEVGDKNLTVHGDVYVGNVAGGLKEGYKAETEKMIPFEGVRVIRTDWQGQVHNEHTRYFFESEIEEIAKAVPGLIDKIKVEGGRATFNGAPLRLDEWRKIEPQLSNDARERKYYVNADGKEVPASEAYETVSAEGMVIGGHTVKDVQKYIDANGPIYPKRAEREVLMGVSWPVKGIEHRVIDNPENIDFDEKLPNGANRYRIFNGQNDLGKDIIRTTCTLKGEFTNTVTVKPDADSTIYIRLMDVEFNSPMIKDADGVSHSSNEAKIVVDESNGGKVFFVLDGSYVTSNYNYKADTADTKLLKTVYDWMEQFSLEDKAEFPTPEPSTGITDRVIQEDSPLAADGKHIKLTGHWNNNIYIKGPAKGGELWVVLEDFSLTNGKNIIVQDDKDGGTVKFYLKGTVAFAGKNMLVEQSFLDLAETPGNIYMFSSSQYIEQMDCKSVPENRIYTAPKIKIFSEKDKETPTPAGGVKKEPVYTTLQLEEQCFFTAYVHAINLNVQNFSAGLLMENASGELVIDKIVYDGHPLKQGSTSPYVNQIGVIGMFDVRSITGKNPWVMLYVDESGAKAPVIPDALGLHTYSAVEYYAFVN
ncbi:MAG: polymer-forming cytoskeletal protein [Ruminococcus sp.]|nr:polymer-forming cytoskeletal protein [Ruminococcus sp.]